MSDGSSMEMVDPQVRRRRGTDLYQEVMGRPAPEPDSALTATLIDFVFAEVWSRPGLTRKERRLISLACVCADDDPAVMGQHFYGALSSGDLTPRMMVLGLVVACAVHPNADRLKICSVDVGDRMIQVVCGGTNVAAGMKVAVALSGSKVKWHGEGDLVELSNTKIRGEKSEGMICA